MMITAQKARDLMKEREARLIEERRAKATELCECFGKTIEERANNGYNNVNVIVESELRHYVIAELKDYGYTVQTHEGNDTITIRW
jgi:hypothetical protein